jgi:hypothetical protein
MKNAYLYWLGATTVLIAVNLWQFWTPCPNDKKLNERITAQDSIIAIQDRQLAQKPDTVTHTVWRTRPFPVNVYLPGDTVWRFDTITVPDIPCSWVVETTDTCKNDSVALCVYRSIIWQNQLQERNFTYTNRQGVKIIYKPISVPKTWHYQAYLGFNQLTSISTGLQAVTPSGWGFGYGYAPFTQTHEGKVLYQFR